MSTHEEQIRQLEHDVATAAAGWLRAQRGRDEARAQVAAVRALIGDGSRRIYGWTSEALDDGVRLRDLLAALDGAVPPQPDQPSGPAACGRDAGKRPSWMSPGQYDPCPCVRPKGHEGPCGCSDHDRPADAVPALDGDVPPPAAPTHAVAELEHRRIWAGPGPDLGRDAGAYCEACSADEHDYIWPCRMLGRPATPTHEYISVPHVDSICVYEMGDRWYCRKPASDPVHGGDRG